MLPSSVFALGDASGYLCGHTRDAACSCVEGTACSHICEITGFSGCTPGCPVSTYEAEAGQTYDEICAALPQTLPGKLACAAGDTDIPLRWTCDDFGAGAGTYTFRAELENAHCICTAADGLPFITVTVPPMPAAASAEADVRTISDDAQIVTVTGSLPEGAYLDVTEVRTADAQSLLGESEAVVQFAYDIKIMLPGALDEATGEYGEPTEYQPGPENPVTVAITPAAPIDAPAVEVVHIEEDAKTGETTPQPVAVVTPTDNTVEFEAEGFSIYVIRVVNTEIEIHTVNFPVGDFIIEYSTSATGSFRVLSQSTVTLGGTLEVSARYNYLYFKVTPNAGLEIETDGVTANGSPLQASGTDVYTLDVSGAAATTDIAITVTGIYITGTPARGQMMTAVPSVNLGSNFDYVWQSSDNTVDGFSAIPGATGTTFELPDNASYDDKYIRVVATDRVNTSDIYTSAPVGPITADGTITFDISSGSVVIGKRGVYHGFNSAGAIVTGTHLPTNTYTITGEAGSEATGGSVNVSLFGDGDFNVTLDDVTIYTGTKGGSHTGSGICAPVSTSGVVGNGNINITLAGENMLENVSDNPSSSFAALEKTDSNSTLIIDGSGTLHVVGGADSAGIGSSDLAGGGTKNITIKGGTIIAETRSSQGAGIGSGNNCPAYNICILGGNITATGSANGAGIGGSGSVNFTAAMGEVYIYGGTINAKSNGTGAGIGGGGSGDSGESTGGAGEVHIYGGTIITDSIGGGDGGQFGGAATVTISGGSITATGSIGGGNSIQGGGGTATITIEGGTIIAANISGGHGANNSHAGETLHITGGSAKVGHVCPAIATTGVGSGAPLTYNIYVANGGSAARNKKVTAIDISPEVSYGLNDVYTDDEGRLYLWLPVDTTVNSVTVLIDSNQVECPTATTQAAAYITPEAVNGYIAYGQTLTAHITYGTPAEYRWEKLVDNTWTAISGAIDDTFTPNISNFGEIRVVIDDTYISPSALISPPQISIVVPTNIVVSVNGAGDCVVTGGAITNNSVVPVYLTGATYTWQTDGPGNDADEVFTGWDTPAGRPEPLLKMRPGAGYQWLDSVVHENIITWSGITTDNSIAPGNEFAPTWGFDLNGSRIALATVIGESVTIASVVYTVGYLPTS